VLIRIDINQTADAVVDEVRNLDRDDSPLLVLVDAEGRYAGVLRCWQLFGRRYSGRQLRELAVDVEPIAPEMPIAAAAAHESWLSHDWLPIVDNQKRVLGALSRKTIIRAASRKSSGRREADSLMLDVVGGITQLLGTILDGLLAKRAI
jgi:predicted transcriptional regulator